MDKTKTIIELINGDKVHGDLLQLTEKTLVLDVDQQNKLKIKRFVVKSITPPNPSRTIYYGPMVGHAKDVKKFGSDGISSLDYERNWIIKNDNFGDSWELGNDSTFNADSKGRQGCLNRRFKELPARFKFNFDLKWVVGFDLQIDILSNCNYRGDAFVLRMNKHKAELLKRSNTDSTARLIGNVKLVRLINSGNNNGHFSIRVDRNKNVIALFHDGLYVKHWKVNLVEHSLNLNGFKIITKSHSEKFSLGNIFLGEWSTKLMIPFLEKGEVVHPREENFFGEKNNMIFFENNDGINFSRLGIKSATANIKSTIGDLKIPIKTVKYINLSQKKLVHKNSSQWVKVFFLGGHESLSGELLDIKEGKITMKSDWYGEVSFELSKLESIILRPKSQ